MGKINKLDRVIAYIKRERRKAYHRISARNGRYGDLPEWYFWGLWQCVHVKTGNLSDVPIDGDTLIRPPYDVTIYERLAQPKDRYEK